MNDSKLKNFITQEAIKGTDPQTIREGLLQAGWDKKEVDKTIRSVYGIKKKITRTFVFLITLSIIIFSATLLLLFFEFFYEKEPEQPREPERPELSNKCEHIISVEEKENCYLKKIEEGFFCQDLSEQETFYCNRVLEFFLLDALQ